jgi:hypothetical protein
MLVSRDPRVLNNGLSIISQNRPMMDALRRWDAAVSGGVTSVARNTALQQGAEAIDPPQVSKLSEALKLKKGTVFIDPNGVRRVAGDIRPTNSAGSR